MRYLRPPTEITASIYAPYSIDECWLVVEYSHPPYKPKRIEKRLRFKKHRSISLGGIYRDFSTEVSVVGCEIRVYGIFHFIMDDVTRIELHIFPSFGFWLMQLMLLVLAGLSAYLLLTQVQVVCFFVSLSCVVGCWLYWQYIQQQRHRTIAILKRVFKHDDRYQYFEPDILAS